MIPKVHPETFLHSPYPRWFLFILYVVGFPFLIVFLNGKYSDVCVKESESGTYAANIVVVPLLVQCMSQGWFILATCLLTNRRTMTATDDVALNKSELWGVFMSALGLNLVFFSFILCTPIGLLEGSLIDCKTKESKWNVYQWVLWANLFTIVSVVVAIRRFFDWRKC